MTIKQPKQFISQYIEHPWIVVKLFVDTFWQVTCEGSSYFLSKVALLRKALSWGTEGVCFDSAVDSKAFFKDIATLRRSDWVLFGHGSLWISDHVSDWASSLERSLSRLVGWGVTTLQSEVPEPNSDNVSTQEAFSSSDSSSSSGWGAANSLD